MSERATRAAQGRAAAALQGQYDRTGKDSASVAYWRARGFHAYRNRHNRARIVCSPRYYAIQDAR